MMNLEAIDIVLSTGLDTMQDVRAFLIHNDQAARARLIARVKPLEDELLQQLAAAVKSQDEAATGMVLDKLRERLLTQSFPTSGPAS